MKHTRNSERFIYTGSENITVIKNSALQCANCLKKLSTVTICEKYDPKPLHVLNHSKECEFFSD